MNINSLLCISVSKRIVISIQISTSSTSVVQQSTRDVTGTRTTTSAPGLKVNTIALIAVAGAAVGLIVTGGVLVGVMKLVLCLKSSGASMASVGAATA